MEFIIIFITISFVFVYTKGGVECSVMLDVEDNLYYLCL